MKKFFLIDTQDENTSFFIRATVKVANQTIRDLHAQGIKAQLRSCKKASQKKEAREALAA